MTIRLKNIKIANYKMLAILFFMTAGLYAQTGSIRVFLFDTGTKDLLKDRKVAVQVNDSVMASFHYSDYSGRVIIELPVGKYNLAIKPEGYELMKVEEVVVNAGEPTYLTYSFEKSVELQRKRQRH